MGVRICWPFFGKNFICKSAKSTVRFHKAAAITLAAACSQVVEWYQPQMKVFISKVRFFARGIRATEEPQ